MNILNLKLNLTLNAIPVNCDHNEHFGVSAMIQEDVTGYSIKRTSQMHDSGGFGSGNFLPQPFGIVNWCIIEMEADTSKHLPPLVVAEIPFYVRQNRYTKEFSIPIAKTKDCECRTSAK
jgi:hypothetical protein